MVDGVAHKLWFSGLLCARAEFSAASWLSHSAQPGMGGAGVGVRPAFDSGLESRSVFPSGARSL